MISVVVPIYNGARHICKCLDSLCNQTIFTDLEIILVNDGSRDASKMIIDQYATRNMNIKAIHISNQGVSNARNVGVAAAQGEYIAFVDADDYIEKDYYERMLSEMKPNVDIVCNGYIVEYPGRTVVRKSKRFCEYDNVEAIKDFLLSEYISPNVWDKLFRRSIVEENQFITGLSLGEDKCFVFDCVCRARSVVVCPMAGYHYVINETSAVHSGYSVKKLNDDFYVAEYIREKANRAYPQFEGIINSQYIDSHCRMYTELFGSGLSESCLICGYVKENTILALSEEEVSSYVENVEDAIKGFDGALMIDVDYVAIEEIDELDDVVEVEHVSVPKYLAGSGIQVIAEEVGKVSSVAATSVDSTSIKVSWDMAENAASYRVYRSLTRSGGYAVVTTIKDGTVTEWTDTGLESGITYYYKIRPYAANGTAGEYSAAASAVVQQEVAVEMVEAPANVAATAVDATTIKVSWEAVEHATGYIIQRSLTKNGGYAVVATIEDGAATEWTDVGLETGTTYYYVMRAIAPSGKQSAYSVKVNAVPKEQEVVVEMVEAPANVAAMAIDATTIKVSWGEVEHATGYIIQRSLTQNGGYAVVATIKDGATTEWTDVGLETGTTYYYVMRAVAPSGKQSAYSVKVSAVPIEIIEMVEAPANVAAMAIDATTIKVSWEAVEHATGYIIQRSLTQNGGYAVVATIEDGAATEWTDTGLETGTTYYYVMRAVAPSGKQSAYSVKVSAVPKEQEDTSWQIAPELSYSVEGTTVTLNWVHDFEGVQYRILRNGLEVCEATDERSYSETVEPGSYAYDVIPVKDGVLGEMATVEVEVIDDSWKVAPELTATVVKDTTVILSWTHDHEGVQYKLIINDDERLLDEKGYVFTGEEGATYSCKVVAVKNGVEGEYSEIKTVSLEDNRWKDAPRVGLTQVDGSNISFEWDHAYEVEGFLVYVDDQEEPHSFDGDVYSATIENLPAGEHSIKICAYKTIDGEQVCGAYAEFTASVEDLSWMEAPSYVNAVVNDDGSVTISWEHDAMDFQFAIFDNGKCVEVSKVESRNVTIPNVSAGAHTFMVCAAKWDEEGNVSYGEGASCEVTIEDTSWKAAPQITGNRVDGDIVILEWVHDYADVVDVVDGYAVFEGENHVGDYAAEAWEAWIRDVSAGEHSYKIAAYKWINGERVYGEFSAEVAVSVVDDSWKESPVLSVSIVNETDIMLSWVHNHEGVEYKVVINNDTYTSVTPNYYYEGVAGESYDIKVVAVKDGVEGYYSETRTVILTEEWKSAPVIVNKRVGGDAVYLGWVHDYVVDGYHIFEGNEVVYTLDGETRTAELNSVETGEHTYKICAYRWNGSEYVYGSSAEVTVTVEDTSWMAAPTNVTAVADDNRNVTITWEHDAEDVKFAIFENDGIIYFTEPGERSVTIESVDLGVHTYMVRAAKWDDEGNITYGRGASDTVTVEDMSWKAAPYDVASQVVDTTVNLSWSHDYEVDGFDVFEGEESVVRSYGECSVSINDVIAGDHTYSIRAFKFDGAGVIYGAAVEITVTVEAAAEASPFAYTVKEDGTLAITGFAEGTTVDNGAVYTIPAAIDGMTVTEIAENAFNGSADNRCHILERINLPASVTSIGNYAFYECGCLLNISMPGVTSIGTGAFFGCGSLMEISIPAGMEYIGEGAFEHCWNIGKLDMTGMNDDVELHDQAFRNCGAILVVNADSKIYNYAHERELSYLVKGDANVGLYYEFEDREDGRVARITGFDGNIQGTLEIPKYYEEMRWVHDKESDKVVQQIIRYPIVAINNNVFGNQHGMTRLDIWANLDSIGDGAFENCSNLEHIAFLGEELNSIGNGAFQNCDSLVYVQLPESVEYLGNSAFGWCSSLADVYIENAQQTGTAGGYNLNAFEGSTRVVLHVYEGSDAENYALASYLPYAYINGSEEPANLEVRDVYIYRSCGGVGDYAIWRPYVVGQNGQELEFQYMLMKQEYHEWENENGETEGSVDFIPYSDPTDWTKETECRVTFDFTGTYKMIARVRVVGTDDEPEWFWPNHEQEITIWDRNDESAKYFQYVVSEDGSFLRIVGYDGMYEEGFNGILEIPSIINALVGYEKDEEGNFIFDDWGNPIRVYQELPVTEIGSGAFQHNDRLTTVIIPEGVAYIGENAFKNNSELVTVELPETIVNIDNRAFQDCVNLNNIGLGHTQLKYLGESAFQNCDYLDWITLPEGLEVIRNNTFNDCDYLNGVTMPSTLVRIESNAFENCHNLYEVNLKEGLVQIQYRAFANCNNLREIELPSTLADVENEFGYAKGLDNEAFDNCNNLRTVSIPAGVKILGYGTFRNCHNLISVDLGSVTAIENSVFENCGSLETISIPAGVTEVGNGTFRNCHSLYRVDLNNVETIQYGAFEYCGNLKYIDLSNAVNINHRAFADCNALGQLDFTKYTTEWHPFNDNPFEGCQNVTLLVNNETGPHWFARDWGVNYVVVNAEAETWRLYYDYDWDNKTASISGWNWEGDVGPEGKLVIPATVEHEGETFKVVAINDHVFQDRFKITSLEFAEGSELNWIGHNAFEGCTNLASVQLPGSMYFIGDSAFARCERLTEITIPGGVEQIHGNAFGGCRMLEKVVIDHTTANPMKFLGENIFSDCPRVVLYVNAGSWAENYAKACELRYVTDTTETAFNVLEVFLEKGCGGVGERAVWSSHVVGVGEGQTVEYQYQLCDYFGEACGEPSDWTTESTYITEFNKSGDYRMKVTARIQGTEIYSECISNDVVTASIHDENTKFAYIFVKDGVRITRCDDYGYYYNKDTDRTVLDIPSEIYVWEKDATDGSMVKKAYPVKEIGEYAFSNTWDYQEVIIPGSVHTIHEGAFREADGLESITIPASVAMMGDWIFENCDNLRSVTFAVDATEDGVAGAQSIGNKTFAGCYKLNSVALPSTLTSIGWETFMDCDRLPEISIPAGVSSIGDRAFLSCDNLWNVSFAENSALTSIGNGAFEGCHNLCSISLPAGLTGIGDSAFNNCNLEEITIPAGVTRIGSNAFNENGNLTYVNMDVANGALSFIGDRAFRKCYNLRRISLPNTLKTIEEYAFEDCHNLSSITLPAGIETIQNGVFANCGRLETIEIPAGMNYQDEYGKGLWWHAFDGFNGTVIVDMNSGAYEVVKNCGVDYLPIGNATEDMHNRLMFDFIEGREGELMLIGYNACDHEGDDCHDQPHTALEGTLIIPASVTWDDKTYPVTAIGGHAIEGFDWLTGLVIPESVTEIHDWAFANNCNLLSLNFAGENPQIRFIGEDAFNCSCRLTSVNLPASLEEIHGGAFANCGKLSEVRFNSMKTDFGDGHVFDNSPRVVLYVLPGSDAETFAQFGVKDEEGNYDPEWNPIPYNNGNNAIELKVQDVEATRWTDAVGDWAEWQVYTIGGTAPYTYHYEVYCDGTLCEDSVATLEGDNSYSYTFIKCGAHTLKVTVTDANGATSSFEWEEMTVGYEDVDGMYRFTYDGYDDEGKLALRLISAYDHCGDENGDVYVPSEVQLRYDDENVSEAMKVTKIGRHAFANKHWMNAVILPDTIERIDDSAFENCYNLWAVNVDENNVSHFDSMPLTHIGHSAFRNTNLNGTAQFPMSLIEIDDSAFRDTNVNALIFNGDEENRGALERIGNEAFQNTPIGVLDLSATSVEEIGNDAFAYCGNMTEAILPDTLTELGACAFNECGSLEKVNLQDTSLRYIGGSAFECCYQLKEVTLPSTLVDIVHGEGEDDWVEYALGSRVFYDCHRLVRADLSATGLTTTWWAMFENCHKLTEVSFPDTLNEIDNYCFKNCGSLQMWEIPESVRRIGDNAFEGCHSIEGLNIGENVVDFGDDVFCDTGICLNVEAYSEAMYYALEYDMDFNITSGEADLDALRFEVDEEGNAWLVGVNTFFWNDEDGEHEEEMLLAGDLEIPSEYTVYTETEEGFVPAETYPVVGIEDWALSWKDCITSVTIPESVTIIGESAFEGCERIEWVEIQGNVTSIGQGAFAYCRLMQSINLPDSLTELGSYAFEECWSLHELEMPALGTWKEVIDEETGETVVEFSSIGENVFFNHVAIVLFVEKGSAAEKYAQVYGFAYNNGEDAPDLKLVSVEVDQWASEICYGVEDCDHGNCIARWKAYTYPYEGNYQFRFELYRNSDFDAENFEEVEPYAVQDWSERETFEFTFSVTGDYIVRAMVRELNETGEAVTTTGYTNCLNAVTIDNYYPIHDEEEGEEIGGYRYAVIGNDEEGTELIRIDRYEGPGGDVDVPMHIGDMQVIEIGYGAYAWRDDIEQITIAPTIRSIGDYAFAGTYNWEEGRGLTNVVFGTWEDDSCAMSYIGMSAFEGSGIRDIWIPDSVEYVRGGAFYDCHNLEDVHLPKNLLYVSDNVFGNCFNLGYLDEGIPAGISSIGVRSFANCHSLTSIIIPASCTEIDEEAFAGCINLASVTFKEGSDLKKIMGAFAGCSALTEIEIPKSVEYIGDYAFGDWSFGEEEYAYCEKLASVTFEEGSALKYIGVGAFYKCAALTEIAIPDGVTTIRGIAFDSCYNLESVTLPAGLADITNYMFANCHSLNNVIIPNGVKSIGTASFAECYALTGINIPASVTLIEKEAFHKSGLTSITVPATVTDMWDGVFSECTALETAVIEAEFAEGYKYLRAGTFAGCTSLSSVTLPDDLTGIGTEAFDGCTSLTAIDLPSDLIGISPYAFAGSGLTTIEFPNGFKSVDEGAFCRCKGLTEIAFPDSVTEIHGYALGDCPNLVSVTLPVNLENVTNYMFVGCTSLTSVNIPENVGSIGMGSFAVCTALESLTIPENVVIEENAFEGITETITLIVVEGSTAYNYAVENNIKWELAGSEILFVENAEGGATLVSYSGDDAVLVVPATYNELTVTAIGEGAFEGNDTLVSITLPDTITVIGKSAFANCTALNSMNAA